VYIFHIFFFLQWLYLLKVFDDHDMCQRLGKQAESFRDVHSKFTVGLIIKMHMRAHSFARLSSSIAIGAPREDYVAFVY
jgi:hypothetical protein